MGCGGSKPQATSAPANKPKKKASSSGNKAPQDNSKAAAVVEPTFADSDKGGKFQDMYKLGEVLGSGAFSTVRVGYYRPKNKLLGSYAIKCITKSKMSPEDTDALMDEVSILREMDHPNIIGVYSFFDEPKLYYLVMERVSGGELFDRIVSKAYYNEREARDLCKILLEAIGYCHSKNVAHRDLKPENLLLLSDKDDASIKLADFGFAKKCTEKKLKTQCGTPGYVAPEILHGTPYDTKADMWSVGVILYILLGGYPPFIENNQRQLFAKIKAGDFEFHPEYWDNVSDEAKNLISSLLTVDPVKRLNATESLMNPWIGVSAEELAGKDLGKNLEEFRRFNGKRKLRAAVHAIIITNRMERKLGVKN